MKTKYELLRQAAAVVDGIPTDDVWLGMWFDDENGDRPGCGLIACAGGWIALSPFGESLGLCSINFGKSIVLRQNVFLNSIDSLAVALRLKIKDAEELFAERGFSRFDRAIYVNTGWVITDKDLFRARVRAFLMYKGEPLESDR